MPLPIRFWHTAAMARMTGFASGFSYGWSTPGHSAEECVWEVGWIFVWVLCAAAGGCGLSARAQDADVTTLHVYANTIQIPVLVLGEDRKKIAPIAPGRFSVSVDGGPQFRASHVRLEGDDPISLSILLDVSGPEAELMPKISDAIAGLAPVSLRPQDHVTVYALDCGLSRLSVDFPASPEMLKLQVAGALKPWKERKRDKLGACQKSVHLWDALTYMTNELFRLPGRHVILAVSDGSDKGSRHRWNELRTFAQSTGVAIFGMSYVPNDPTHIFLQERDSENAFDSICELSGGLVFTMNRRDVEKKLSQFMELVRGRYIVEFPRPNNSTKGWYELAVTIDKSKAFIRPAGIAVPVADAKELNGPTTVHSDPSLAPKVGDRHILQAPR